MKTGILKYNRKGSGFELKRLVAMLLVLVQCASLAFVGAPVAYAEEEPQDALVDTQYEELPEEPELEEDEPEPDPDEPEFEAEGGTLEAELGGDFAVSVIYEADAGIPADATLEIRVPDYSEDEAASFEARMLEALSIGENDHVFSAQLFELYILDAEGEPVHPACPVEVCIRFPGADGSLAETFSAVGFGGAPENATALGASGWSAEGCILRFDTQSFGLFGVCSWVKEQLELQMQDREISVYGPTCAVVSSEPLAFTPKEENRYAEEAWSLRASSDAPDGGTALWARIRLKDTYDAEQGYVLYSLRGGELFKRLRISENEDALIPLRGADGFALITFDPETPLSGDVTVMLTGEEPRGIVVTAEDVSDMYADFDLSSLLEPEEKLDSAFLQHAPIFVFWALQMVQGAQTVQIVENPDKPAYELIGAYDITLTLDDEEFQPDADHPIRVSITNPGIREDRDLQLWHIHDDDSKERITDFEVVGNTLSFDAAGFSVYLIVAENGGLVTPQCTFTFYVPNDEGGYTEYPFKDDQGNTVFKQTIKSGDELIVPQPVPEENMSFAGWYQGTIVSGAVVLEDEPYDFDNIQITENSAVDLYAVFNEFSGVLFYGQYDEASGTFPLAYTRRAELSGGTATVQISDVHASYTRSDDETDMAFFGWSYTPISTPGAELDDNGDPVARIEGDSITISGQTKLYPIFRPIHWLRFYAAKSGKGAVYNAPRYYYVDDEVTTPLPTTSLAGYHFVGWYIGSLSSEAADVEPVGPVKYGTQLTDENGQLVQEVSYESGVEVLTGLKMYIHKDVTIYAKWEADQQADYTIAIWKQLASDADGLPEGEKHYEYLEGFTLTGAVGSTVSVPEEYRQRVYAGYSYARCDDDKTVLADGSTVLNVYYDKDSGYSPTGSYTLKFVDSYTGDTLEEIPALAYGTPLAGKTPANPSSTRPGYEFSDWYLDNACTVSANLSAMTMPDHDLTVYAGWKLIWYLVKIDPNYGELAGGTGSTWFWQTIEDEPIGEYTYVTRNYVPSSSGSYYYVKHDLAYYNDDPPENADRKTYYTTDPGEATEDTTFERVPGVYTYAGWYEVKNGAEESEPYDFSQKVNHDTTLRLHWKKNGVYYLAYNAAVSQDGSATISGTVNGQAEELIDAPYEDYAVITLDRTADPPSGYTFIGWQVRGDDSGIVYRPGQVLTLRADCAVRISGKDIVYLDAVYAKLGTASVVYDANGGTVADNGVDFGKSYNGEAWEDAVGTVDTSAGTATVSGLTNNSRFKLSDGRGFHKDGGEFLGWSNRAAYDPDDPGAVFFPKSDTNAIYGVDTNDPKLYAVWGLKVTYHLNQTEAEWGAAGWDGYDYDAGSRTYSRTVYVNNPVEEPSGIPVYTGSAALLFRYWTTASDSNTEYDFSQPVTGALDLYGYWSEPNVIQAHAVDASQEALADVTGENGWTVNGVTAGVTAVELTGDSHVTAPTGYTYAFAAAARDLASVSDRNAVTALRYDSASRRVCVQYEGDSSFTPLEDGQEIWFVYYREKELPISYRSMASSGVLTTAAVSGAPTVTSALGTYDMTGSVTQPLDWAGGSYTHYAFAVGTEDPGSGQEMNASALCLITDAFDSDTTRPQLQLRNTWKGFEYSTDGGGSWVRCGYDVQPYVIYYTKQPTVVLFRERTVGIDTDEVMGKAFTFNLLVTQTTQTTTSVQKQKLTDEGPVDVGEPVVTVDRQTKTINNPYLLRNGEANTAILFSDGSTISEPGAQYTEGEDSYQDVTTTTVSVVQTATITQDAEADFSTAINSVVQTAEPYAFTASSGSAERVEVTFTNTHKTARIEIHLALVENSGIIRRDGDRYLTSANCSFDLALGESKKIIDMISREELYRGENYAFGDVIYGTGGVDGAAVTSIGMGVVTVAYEQIGDNVYGLILKDGSGNRLAALDGRELYYLYYPMPRIEYVKLGENGTLTPVKGSDGRTETEAITYNYASLHMNNGQLVTQGQRFEISMSDFVIGQSGSDFRMPPVLDDGLNARYLSYSLIGAGDAGVRTVSGLRAQPSDGLTMHLRITEAEHASVLQFSYDGQSWRDLPLSGIPTIYAIYTERGYDLQISKTLAVPESEKSNPIFDGKSFTVRITSTSITKAEYEAEGAEATTIPATPAAGSVPGSIVLTVADGTKVKIKALSQGDYTITETDNTNYILTAKAGNIAGAATDVPVTNNSKVELTLNNEKRVELTNSPQPLCRIVDNGSEQIFYTLRSAVKYIEDNIATYTATIEMLADYLIPAADSVEIPSGFDVTLITAESFGRVSKITRGEDLDGEPIFKNSGSLTLQNVALDGASVNASRAMIESDGAKLVLDRGVTVEKAVNSGNGGALTVTAGDLTINDASLTGNSAANGGAFYYAGGGNVTVSGGSVTGNTADDNGGAIYIVGGTLAVKDDAVVSNNSAGSNGGAICADNAVVTVSDTAKLENNKAAGSGGAIHIGGGSVTVSGGSVKGNKALGGSGGAICTGSGSVTVSGGSVTENSAKNDGGAICTGSGSVTVSGGSVSNNEATSGKGGAICTDSGVVAISGSVDGTAVSANKAKTDGGAIYAGSGSVTVSGGSVSKNTATEGSGGAIYAGSGNVTVSGGAMGENKAGQNGGAVYAGKGAVTVSCDTLSDNEAQNGKGGAIFADEGAVSVDGTAVSANKAKGDGGAIYANKGAVTLKDVTMGGADADKGNVSSAGSGGAVYAGSGNVTVTGSETKFQNNAATAGNGGALYAGSGFVTVTNAGFTGNKADAGQGGALYLDSGPLTLTTVNATGNSAVNGAAVFTNTGRTTFSGGSVTGNTASAGGAVGVGSINARLYFSGNVKVQNNTLGSSENAPKSNLYLDQDTDAVINIEGLGTGADIGIYVPDGLVQNRSVPGARFAFYTNNSNVSKITNDRFESLKVQSDTEAKKLYWGNPIKVEVRYLASYDNGFPPETAGVVKYTNDSYYPGFDDGAISELAAELYTKFNLGLTATAVYGGAFALGAQRYDEYVTKLVWNTASSSWTLTGRDGTTTALNGRKIIIYYAEPAYIAIENNTAKQLNISSLTVKDYPVINSSTVAGYGMVFAKNGAIRSALLPVTAEDLSLSAGSSITLLIPGGRNMAYTLSGGFTPAEATDVRLRRGTDGSMSEETISTNAEGSFSALTGSTLNSTGTYRIIFGDDKPICKVVDSNGDEHPYNKISAALTEIKNGTITLETPKTAVIEMLVDYLLPASDPVAIPRGYDITLTTAAKDVGTYVYTGEGDRATISRDSENMESMINAWNADNGRDTVNALDGTTLTVKNLIFDGKSVRGSSDGGAIKSKYVNVYVDNVDFRNVYANNGGAMLIMFSAKDKNNKATVPGTELKVKDANFHGCTSTTTESSNRLGGGAIVTNAETMRMENCHFDTCTAVDQAGAVFHRVDNNYNSWTYITGCSFSNCRANAAGGLELDSKTIYVSDTSFTNCVAIKRNGGGFNIYALNTLTPSTDCSVTVKGCTFNDCQLTDSQSNGGNGGGFRSNAVRTTVIDSTFTTCSALYGGGFCISNGNATEGNILGCTFDRCSANQGGGVFGKPKSLVIGDYVREDGTVRHTEIRSCTAKNEGGGVYQDKNANGSSMTITNAVITGNQTTNNGKNGGGVFTNVRTVEISGATIDENQTKGAGGGLYAYSYTSLTIADSSISKNVATGNGGGVWFDGNDDNARKNMTLTVKGSTLDNNSSGNNGGGIYTLAKTVTIRDSETRTDNAGKPIPSVISNCTAKIGGGVYHDRFIAGSTSAARSTLTLTNSRITDCRASANNGGGIRTNAFRVNASGAEISRNTASTDGGGIWYDGADNNTRDLMELSMEGCTLDGNTAGNNGGGIYTLVKTVSIGKNGQTGSTISNCTAKNGGGVYQSRDVDGSTLTVSGTTISGCRASASTANATCGGGGIYGLVRTILVKDGSEISGNTAVRDGGGILALSNGNNQQINLFNLTIDASSVSGNTAGNQGGGVYSGSQLTIRGGTEISGNKLSSNTYGNAAGVYLPNNRTLTVGTAGAAIDDSSIRNNTTATGEASNLRLWSNTDGQNNKESVFVNCPLRGEILVLNANKVGTQFGSSLGANYEGFTETAHVFQSDHSTLYGIYDRTDEEGKKIIWAGPPIAKITDGEGNLLYMSGGRPAIFDRLDTDNNGAFSKISAFSMLRTAEPELFTKVTDDNGEIRYEPYTGSDYCIKMLVENYETNTNLTVLYYEGRSLTFTTAGKNAQDEDGYPYSGRAERATVVRGAGVGNKSMISTRGNLTLESIIIDGGTENGVQPGTGTRCMWIGGDDTPTVTLGVNATIQNAKADNGGGVYVGDRGTFEISGGVIRNCKAGNGGAVYMTSGQPFSMTAGNIIQCSADNGGGGVYINSGTFNMSGGRIDRCDAKQGGGLFVANKTNNTFNMSGGFILGCTAQTKGGGIAVGGASSRLNFSKKVTVSGNTCDSSKAPAKACNIELDQDSNGVINTNNGGLFPGSYLGVYVPDGTNLYDKHGDEKKPFGTFAEHDNKTNFYSFVNDRNGLKGGIIENPDPNTIYWIQIFALKVTKEVETSASETVDESFHFKVTVYGAASVPGQLNAWQIDSETGFYGEMDFHSDGVYATVAEFDLMPGESVTAVNLSEGLHYEVEEVLTEEQARKYAVLPAVKLSGLIGENKGRTDIDPYTSALVYTNRLPVCKLTDQDRNLLYRRITVDAGNGEKSYNVPAVYLNLEDGFKAVEDALTATGSQADRKLYTGEDLDSQSYAVSQGVKLELLVSTTLNEAQTVVENETLTLTTASSKPTDEFPFRGSGSMATVWRDFPDGSMLTVDSGAALSITGITVDGSKSQYTVSSDGGAVYVKSGAVLSVSDSVIQNHQIDADHNGAGIYLGAGSRLNLSENLDFGGKGTEVTGRIKPSGSSMGNFKNTTLPDGSKNGGWEYTTPRQDIYLAEANENAPQDIVITGNLSGDNGCIWVWAASEYHYKQNMPFARLADRVDGGKLMVFRNARPDDETDNGTDTWLYGCLDEDNYPGYVCWSGVKGSRRVILRKVDASLQSLQNAQFDVHRGSPDGQIVTIKYDDGTTETLENLSSNTKGILWVGDLPYGTYFLHEKNPVNAWFALIVDDPEFVAPDADPFISGPHDSDGAISAANAKNLEIKAAKQAARTP